MNPRDILCKLLGFANTSTDEQLLAALAAYLGLANNSTIDQVLAAFGSTNTLQAVANARTTAETSLLNVTRERDNNAAALMTANSHLATERTTLANVRKEYATSLVDAKIASGHLTAAERDTTLAGFVTNFANSATALAARPKGVKTESKTGNLGDRRTVVLDNARARQTEVQRLVATEEATLRGKGVEDAYGQAFANVEAAHPELFTAMAQPKYMQKDADAA